MPICRIALFLGLLFLIPPLAECASDDQIVEIVVHVDETLGPERRKDLVAALEAQARKLWHCSNLYHIAPQELLAERLVAHSFADRSSISCV